MKSKINIDFAQSIHDRLIKQLTTANEHLQQFAYIASHDLREPIRVIVNFTDLLAHEYGDQLDRNARQYMEICRQAAIKIEAVVSDLLDYGRLGQEVDHIVKVDVNHVLRQVINHLPHLPAQTRIDYADLPILKTNPIRLERLFQNLIWNAIQYRETSHAPHIIVTAHRLNNYWQFTVDDNGIGIHADYLETIFNPFKRLHNDHEYTGTGIGLAICKRIVESLDGKIWVTSTLGKGSHFSFTLPA